MGEIRRISLLDVREHSSLCEKISFMGDIELTIRPWNMEITDDLKPLLLKILADLKDFQEKDLPIIDTVIMLLEQKWTEYKDLLLHAIYVTIARDNAKVTWKLGDGDDEYDIFTEEHMCKELMMPDAIEILRKAFELNLTKNLSAASLKTIEGAAKNKVASTTEMINKVAETIAEQGLQQEKNAPH